MTILSKLVSHNLLAGLILAVVIQPGLANPLLLEELSLDNHPEDISATDSLPTLAQTLERL